MKNIYRSLIILTILYTSCKSDCNKNCTEINFDCDCCPQADTTLKALPKSNISSINIFLDISGSMDGYMPNSMPPTNFQLLLPEILSKFKTEYPSKVFFFTVYDSNNKIKREELENARNEILHGTFSWTGNTYLPVMLDSIEQKYLKKESVNMFISDCIYSPKKDDAKLSNLATTDIRDEFKPFTKTFSTSILNLSSEFRDREIKVDSSPYYMLLCGQPENLKVVENILMNSFVSFKQSFHEIHFGQQYSLPFYSILPYTETTGNFDATAPCNSFSNAFVKIKDINLSEINQVKFWVGIDLGELPEYAREKNYLDSNLNLRLSKGAVIKNTVLTREDFISKVHVDDKNISEKCTHFVQIIITELSDQVSSMTISIKNNRPTWVNLTNHDDIDYKEKNRQQTFGLAKIVSGLEQAYNIDSSSLFFKPITISLIKE